MGRASGVHLQNACCGTRHAPTASSAMLGLHGHVMHQSEGVCSFLGLLTAHTSVCAGAGISGPDQPGRQPAFLQYDRTGSAGCE